MMTCQCHDANPTYSNRYLWPALTRVIEERDWPDRRAFDLGCGNGATCGLLSALGFSVTGIDSSQSGIAQARAAFPNVRTEVASVYDNLAGRYRIPVDALPRLFKKTLRSPSLAKWTV